jgi:hypothetical protein
LHGHEEEKDDHDSFVPAELDNKANPEITFNKAYDHIFH